LTATARVAKRSRLSNDQPKRCVDLCTPTTPLAGALKRHQCIIQLLM